MSVGSLAWRLLLQSPKQCMLVHPAFRAAAAPMPPRAHLAPPRPAPPLRYNINVSHGQTAGMIDSLFTGNRLGHSADIADGSLRTYDFRTYNNIVGDYYVAPRWVLRRLRARCLGWAGVGWASVCCFVCWWCWCRGCRAAGVGSAHAALPSAARAWLAAHGCLLPMHPHPLQVPGKGGASCGQKLPD